MLPFIRPSNLDNLCVLSIHDLQRNESNVGYIASFVSRAHHLKTLVLSFYSHDADISVMIGNIISNDSIQTLSLSLRVRNKDITVLPDLISQSRSIHHLHLYIDNIRDDLFYDLLQKMESSCSIVKFHLICQPPTSLNYRRIAAGIQKCRVLNDLTLFEKSVGEEQERVVDSFFADCVNLERLQVKRWERVRESFQDELTSLIKISRTFCGARWLKESRVPTELLDLILVEGFKKIGWVDGQFGVVKKVLMDRRSLGLVYSDALPLSKSYLYVRCRDALDKIRITS